MVWDIMLMFKGILGVSPPPQISVFTANTTWGKNWPRDWIYILFKGPSLIYVHEGVLS